MDSFQTDLRWCIGQSSGQCLGQVIGPENAEQHLPRGVAGFWQGTMLPVADDAPWFFAEFDLEDLPDCSWVLLDVGDNGDASWSQIYLNGRFVAERWGRKAGRRFPIPVEWLVRGKNALVVVCKGGYWCVVDEDWEIGPKSECFEASQLTPQPSLRIAPVIPIGKIGQLHQDEGGVTITTAGPEKIRITFPAQRIVRITVAVDDPAAETLADRVCLSETPLPTEPFTVNEGEVIKIHGPQVEVSLTRNGKVSIRHSDRSIVVKNLRFLCGDGMSMAEWPLEEDEHIFGLGCNATQGMDKRGQVEPMWVTHDFRRCDVPVPFMLSTGGYGLYMHGSHWGEFDLGCRRAGTARCWQDHERIDLFVMADRSFAKLVEDYTFLTGRPELPPRWAFGFWQSSTETGKRYQSDLKKRVETFAQKNLPVDVMAIDANWSEPGYTSLQWNRRLFSDPAGFLDMLKKHRVRLSLWSGPFLNPSASLYDEALRKGYMVRREDGSPGFVNWWVGFDALLLDFLNPEAVDWWARQIAPLIKAGVKIIKIDGGDTNETPPDLVCHGDHSMAEVHNLYPVLFAKAVHEGIRQFADGQRTLTWIRTGFTGVQRYPCSWGGDQFADFNGGRVLIRAGQQAGLAGISFWSHDLGGFAGDATLEYHVRSFQWGLLSPLARAHGAAVTPWDHGPQAEATIAKFLKLRYSLLPTIYSYAWQSHRSGQPMMRAMVLDHQDDSNCYCADFQYMFGPDLLVAPIYQPASGGSSQDQYEKDQSYMTAFKESTGSSLLDDHDTDSSDSLAATRRVYIPEGQWYDYWTDRMHRGQQVVTCTVPLDEIPLFVRAGAVLVYGPEVLRADTVPSDLAVHVYAGADGSLTLYEDDGLSYAYQTGEFAETLIKLTDDGHKLLLVIGATSGKFQAQAESHKWNIIVHGLTSCASVRINGKPVDKSTFDRTAGRLSVELRAGLYETLTLGVRRWSKQ